MRMPLRSKPAPVLALVGLAFSLNAAADCLPEYRKEYETLSEASARKQGRAVRIVAPLSAVAAGLGLGRTEYVAYEPADRSRGRAITVGVLGGAITGILASATTAMIVESRDQTIPRQERLRSGLNALQVLREFDADRITPAENASQVSRMAAAAGMDVRQLQALVARGDREGAFCEKDRFFDRYEILDWARQQAATRKERPESDSPGLTARSEKGGLDATGPYPARPVGLTARATGSR